MAESKDYKHVSLVCAAIVLAFSIAAISTPDTISIKTAQGSEAKVGVWRYTDVARSGHQMDCSDMYENDSDCKQQCITMQSFGIIAIVFTFFSAVLSMSENPMMIRSAAFSAAISAVSLLIVWAVVASQFDRESKSTSGNYECSYKNKGDGSEAKLMWGFAFYVVSFILSSVQSACLFFAASDK